MGPLLIVYTLITMATLVGWLGVAWRTLPGRRSERLAAAFVGTHATVVLTTLLLGGFAPLYRPELYFPLRAIVAGLLIWFFRKDILQAAGDLRSEVDLPRGALLFVGVVFLFWGATQFHAWRVPDPGIDAASYHFPMAVMLNHQQGLDYFETRNGHTNEFPKNAQFLFAEMFLAGGDERHVRPLHLVWGIVGVLALFGWMRNVAVGREIAAPMAAMFLLFPVVMGQAMATWGSIDLAIHVLLIVGLGLVAWLPDEWIAARNRVLWAAMAAGLALGTKSQGIVLGSTVLALGIVHLLVRFPARRGSVAGVALFSGAIFLLLGVYTYLQNWFWFNNPLSPIRVKLFGNTIFEGHFKSPHDLVGTKPFAGTESNALALAKSWLVLFSAQWGENPRLGGWGLAFLPMLALGTAGGVVLARRGNWFAAALGLLLLLLLLKTPGSWWARFSMHFLGVVLVYTAVAIAAIHCAHRKRIVLSLLMALSLVSALDAFAGYGGFARREIVSTGPWRHSLDATPEDVQFFRSGDDHALYRWCRDNLPAESTLVYFHPEWHGMNHYFFYRHDLENRVRGLASPESAEDLQAQLTERGATHFIVREELAESQWADDLGREVFRAGSYRLYERGIQSGE